MKNYQQRIWCQIKATPDKTSSEIADIMDIERSTVSHYMTQLFRRNMVERKHRTFINDNARKQTCHEYTVVGNKYIVKPILLVPANPRKHYTEATQETPVHLQSIEKPAPSITLTSYGVDVLDIDNMTLGQARKLRDKLNAFFRGAE